jgi:hypothetical protein
MNRMHPTQEMLNLNAEIVDLYKTQLRMLKELPENSPYRKELIDTCEGRLSLANNRFLWKIMCMADATPMFRHYFLSQYVGDCAYPGESLTIACQASVSNFARSH